MDIYIRIHTQQLTVNEWSDLHYKSLGAACQRIANSPLHPDLLHETIIAFMTHKDAQAIVDSGGAFFYCLRIAMNLWKSQTSPFYKAFKHEHAEIGPEHENIIDQSELSLEEIYTQIDQIIDQDLSWYENMLLKEYAAEGANALRLSKLTGIPRTSISLTLKRIKTHIQSKITYDGN